MAYNFSTAKLQALLLLLLFGFMRSAAKVTVKMQTADCKRLAAKPTWTSIQSCTPAPNCTVYDPKQFIIDNQKEGPVTILCFNDGYVAAILLSQTADSNNGLPLDISGPLPLFWSTFPKLAIIKLDSSKLGPGTLPGHWGYIKSLTTLSITASDGKGTKLTGGLPSNWGLLTNLESLVLSGLHGVSGKLPSEIGLMKKLYELDLADNAFNGTLPASLGRLTSLEYLYLNNNKFIGDPTAVLTKLAPSLIELDLSNNNFSGRLPAALGNGTNLEIIKFYNCRFSGRLPPEWSGLTNIGEIDLRYNKGLVGPIPPSWSALMGILVELYIGRTGIRGPMDVFKSADALDLYIYPETQMCGDIPEGVIVWLNDSFTVDELPACK